MELKKVWMSLDTEKKSHYGYRTVGGILGICVSYDSFTFYWNIFIYFSGIATAKLFYGFGSYGCCIWDCNGCKNGAAGETQDAVIFFLTENDRLWIMDARGLSYHGRGFWGFALGAMETQKFLRMRG